MSQPKFRDKLKQWMSDAAESIIDVYNRTREKLLRRYVPNDDTSELDHVTTTNLEQHRQQILERARRHVKPQPSTESHVIRNSVIVSAVSLIIIAVGLMVGVFKLRPTNTFYYRLSQLAPISVGRVEGASIGYDQVLFHYRNATRDNSQGQAASSSTEQSEEQLLEQSFIEARRQAYIQLLANRQEVNVANQEVEQIVCELPLIDCQTTDLDAVIKQVYGWTRDDLYRETRLSTLASSRILPTAAFQLTRASSLDEFLSLRGQIQDQLSDSGQLSDLGSVPDQLSSAVSQAEPDSALMPINIEDQGAYLLYKTSDESAHYVHLDQTARQTMLNSEINSAESVSCLEELQFSDVNVNIATEQRYANCLF